MASQLSNEPVLELGPRGDNQQDVPYENLLDAIERGEDLVLTRDGKPIAAVASICTSDLPPGAAAKMARVRAFRHKLQAEGRGLTRDEIIALKNEGHGYE